MANGLNESPWFVLRTKGRHEHVVESYLRSREIKAYLPMLRQRSPASGKLSRHEVPLFPGYVFVQPRWEQIEALRFIRGSCGMIQFGGSPAEMPPQQLESVRLLVDSGADLRVEPLYDRGQRVRVVNGPFAGAVGEYLRCKARDRLVINMTLLSSSICVEIEADSVVACA